MPLIKISESVAKNPSLWFVSHDTCAKVNTRITKKIPLHNNPPYNNILRLSVIPFTKTSAMNTYKPGHTHAIVQLVKNFVNKLFQNPEVYPIKYYKKNQRHKRNWKSPMVK